MSIINNKLITVFIDGDKNGFISKNSIDRFKKKIKLNYNFNFDELKQEFIKIDYNLELIDKSEDFIKFNITKKEIIIIKDNIDENKKELKNRLKNIIRSKSNKNSININKNNIPEELIKEYNKLIKLNINKNSIPSPQDIINRPNEFKASIPFILNNPQIKKMTKSHPYIKYLKLIVDYLDASNISQDIPLPNDIESLINNINIESLIDKSGNINNSNIESLIKKAGIINNNNNHDTDTDTEEEIICDKNELINNNLIQDNNNNNNLIQDDDIEIINSYDYTK